MRSYPNLVYPKIKCCGCGLCASLCPKGAIQMKKDQEGFLYPYIDKKKCIKCGACIKSCIYKKRGQQ